MHTSTRVLIDTSWESVTVMLTSFLLASWATDTAVSKSLPSATFSETIAAAFFYVLARARVPRQMWPQCMWCVVCVCERERVSAFFYVLARACVHRQINVTCDPSACGALCMCVWEREREFRITDGVQTECFGNHFKNCESAIAIISPCTSLVAASVLSAVMRCIQWVVHVCICILCVCVYTYWPASCCCSLSRRCNFFHLLYILSRVVRRLPPYVLILLWPPLPVLQSQGCKHWAQIQ